VWQGVVMAVGVGDYLLGCRVWRRCPRVRVFGMCFDGVCGSSGACAKCGGGVPVMGVVVVCEV